MVPMNLLLVLLVISPLANAAANIRQRRQASDYKRVCYYSNWSQYRIGDGRFVPEDIDVNICTHLIFAFANMADNKLVPSDQNDESTQYVKGMYERFTDLKQQNSALVTLLSVGGWNFGVKNMTLMLATPQNRSEFINTSIKYLRDRNFDGLDLDFEWPGHRGSPPDDKQRFSLLIKEMKKAFDDEAANSGNKRLLMTAAVAANKTIVDSAYEVKNISRDLDFINLISYDFHGSWESKTGMHSALYNRSSEQGPDAQLNVNFSANYWVASGCPSEKLIVGMPTYGRSWTLADANNVDVGSAASGPGVEGGFTRAPGLLAYYEICVFEAGGIRVFHSEHRTPYAFQGTQWVGYDDQESLIGKIDWLISGKFGGFMVFSLDYDDFAGKFCNKGKYPLIGAMRDYLENGVLPTTVALTILTTTNPNQDFCLNKPDGNYPDANDCVKYIQCVNGIVVERTCPDGTIFNPANSRCDHPDNVVDSPCFGDPTTTPAYIHTTQ